MLNVVYCAPFPGIATTARFATALGATPGVRLLGVFGEQPSAEVASRYHDHVVVSGPLQAASLLSGVQRLVAKHGPPHRIVGILEDLQVQIAMLNRHYKLPGGNVASAEKFRDKGLMKDALRAAGVPCARHARLRSAQDAEAFVREVGFPQVWKPPAGAGCRATYRIDDAAGLREALQATRPSPEREVLAEEFLAGEEHSFETLCIRGKPLFYSISRYVPGPLEVTKHPWIQWVAVLPRNVSGPEYAEVRRVGFHAASALGMGSGLTHMEWFRMEGGRVAVGEIAMRPPGANFVQLMCYAYDADLYRVWAQAVVHDDFLGPLERKFAVGIVYFRGAGSGRVVSVDGVEAAQRRVGRWVVEAKLPRRGAMKSGHYEGDGFAIVRHPTTEGVMSALRTLMETVKVRYER